MTIYLDEKTPSEDILYHLIKKGLNPSSKKTVIYEGKIGVNLRDKEGTKMFLNALNYKLINHNTTLYITGEKHKDTYSNIIFILK